MTASVSACETSPVHQQTTQMEWHPARIRTFLKTPAARSLLACWRHFWHLMHIGAHMAIRKQLEISCTAKIDLHIHHTWIGYPWPSILVHVLLRCVESLSLRSDLCKVALKLNRAICFLCRTHDDTLNRPLQQGQGLCLSALQHSPLTDYPL